MASDCPWRYVLCRARLRVRGEPLGIASRIYYYCRLAHRVLPMHAPPVRLYPDFDMCPTQWEWQFAAQGGNSSAVYPWGDVFEPSRVPEPDSSRSPRAPDNVGAHPTGAGRYGMQDAVGLVWQFTDRYCSDRQCFSVLKGGSYYTPVVRCTPPLRCGVARRYCSRRVSRSDEVSVV